MARAARFLILLTGVAVASQTATANPQRPRPSDGPRFMRVFGTTLPPYGFVQFCEANPRECVAGPAREQRIALSPELMKQLGDINRLVNQAIQPATDLELYGVAERWVIPVDRGDCEDYALLKRQMLIRRGWPVSALLLTVVRDEKGEGHAVLVARTAQGDYVLDNKVEEIKLWSSTPYEYIMRQSYLNPRVWMSLDTRDSFSPGVLAGVGGAPR